MERARGYTQSVPQPALALPVLAKQAGTALQAGAYRLNMQALQVGESSPQGY